MSAYGVKLPPRGCQVCRNLATVEVFNSKNAPIGFFCGPDGIKMVKALDEVEAADRQRVPKSSKAASGPTVTLHNSNGMDVGGTIDRQRKESP